MNRVLLPVLLVLVLVAPDARAQQRRGLGPRSGERTELEQRVRARFAEMIQVRLGLNEDQSRRLAATMDSFMERRRSFSQEEQALRRRIETLLLDQNASVEEAEAVVARMKALRMEEARLFESEQDALLEFLTPLQLVRFHAMREQLSQRIQQLRGGAGTMGPPGRGPPGGGSDDPPHPYRPF